MRAKSNGNFKVRFGEAPKPAREARALPRPETYSLHIRVRTFAVFGDEAVDPRGDNGQRYRAELEHSIVESADVEFETRSLPNLTALR